MKALRILLQLEILGAGGVTLAALISRPNPDITSILVFLGFLAFLLALTLVLKEHTEERLVPEHKLSFKPMGIVLLLLGAFSILRSRVQHTLSTLHGLVLAIGASWHKDAGQKIVSPDVV